MVDLKELEKIVKFCRKNGVLTLKNSEIEVTLTASEPMESYYKRRKKAQPQDDNQSDTIETDEYTDEQILMWSAGEGFNG